jgi:bloom syndrome protein
MRDHQRSYSTLNIARKSAAQSPQCYDSKATRARLTAIFSQRFGSPPHEWQLDATEAILLSLDSVVIAGTGVGKTMPFMLPLLLDDTSKMLVLSPLKILQEDQVSH